MVKLKSFFCYSP